MIVIKGRQMVIPKEERYIGTTYDNNSEHRVFQIDRAGVYGTDLSACHFRLDLEYENGEPDTSLVDKEVGDDYIILTWKIPDNVLQIPGTVFISIRAFDDQGTVKWATFKAAFYVEDTVNTPGNYTGSLTELEQLEARLSSAENLAKEMTAAETKRQVNEEERIQNEIDRAQAFKDLQDEQDQALKDLKVDLQDARLAESWAVGGTGLREGEDEDNSKYYCDKAKENAYVAADMATSWAIGGTGLREGEDTDNSKFYSEEAKKQAEKASVYARGLNFRGNFDIEETYNAGDFVYYQGSTWVALQDATKGILPAENEHWGYLAKGTENVEMDQIYTIDTYGIMGVEALQVLASEYMDAIAKKSMNNETGLENVNASIEKMVSVRNIDLISADWSDTYPYTQTVAIDGITTDSNLKVIGVYVPDGSTADQVKARNKAAGFLMSNEDATGDGTVTFKAYKKPGVDFTVIVEGG